jgi:hypothetical protein
MQYDTVIRCRRELSALDNKITFYIFAQQTNMAPQDIQYPICPVRITLLFLSYKVPFLFLSESA